MSIKPVLVPDHDAAALRGLIDRFAEATTGPTRQQLAESRAAVAAAQGVSEGVADTKQLLQAYAGLYYNSRESAGNDMDYDAIQQEMDQIEQQIAKQYGPAGVRKLQKYGYEQYHGRGSFDDDVVRESGVAEATMSRAAKGYEKYGREGMAALAKAGREGRDLDKIRDRYNRYDEGAESDVTEGRAGIDDRDTVGFSVNSEAAYRAVMKRFGDAIDHDETSGIMSAPARIWPQIEMTAFDADPDSGAVRVEDEGLAESIDPIQQLRADIRRFAR